MKKYLFVCLLAYGCGKTHRVENRCCERVGFSGYVDSSYVIVPNIFTPNGDRVNDVFCLQVKNMRCVSIEIRNKKDEVIWSEVSDKELLAGTWNGVHTGGKWKGKVVDGAYSYSVTAVTFGGKSVEGAGVVDVLSDPGKYCVNNLKGCRFPDGTSGTFDKVNKSCK